MSNKEILGLHRITKARIKELCKKNNLYQTPHLNDQLYLHYQGFEAIENLEEYTGLKCLWLESNAISEIQGLDSQHELKCLFLQNNLIKKIENLQSCTVLDTLNLESNHITKIENCGVDVLPVLSTLNLSRNYLRTSPGLEELVNCTSLWSLDLSHNRIDDILVIKIFAKMTQLRVLILQGNPVVSQVPQYRKTLILECKNLTYLDSRPVFPKDRACAEAWKRGGYEEERRENERWARIDRKNIRDSVNATLRLRQKHGGGDVQLLESTDDEVENRPPKKFKKILKDDLEITGLSQDETNNEIVFESESKALETSSSDSSGNEPKLYGNKPKKVLEVVGDDNRNHLRTDATDINEKSNDLVKGIETSDSNKDNSSRISKWLGEEMGQVEIESKDINSVNPVVMETSSGYEEQATPWNESSSSGSSFTTASSDTSSNFTIAIDNAGTEEPVVQNEDFKGIDINVENNEKQPELQISLELSGGEQTCIADDILKLDISSESLLYDTSNDKGPLEDRQHSDDENTLWEDTRYHYPIKLVPECPEPSLDTETDISITNWSISEIGNYTSTPFQKLEFSDEEDSGHFNSVDDSLGIKSLDGTEVIPGLENILPGKEKNDKDARISSWQDSILTDLRERKEETTKPIKILDVGEVTVPSEREEMSTDDDQTFETLEVLECCEDVTMPLDFLSTERDPLSSSLFVEGLAEDSDLQMSADDTEASFLSEYLLNDTSRNEVKSLNEIAEGSCLQDNPTSYQESEEEWTKKHWIKKEEDSVAECSWLEDIVTASLEVKDKPFSDNETNKIQKWGAFPNLAKAEGDSDIANQVLNKKIIIQPVIVAGDGSKLQKEILCEDQDNTKLQLEQDEVDNECLKNRMTAIKADPDGKLSSENIEKIKNSLEKSKTEKACLKTIVTPRKVYDDQDKPMSRLQKNENQKTCVQNLMTARKSYPEIIYEDLNKPKTQMKAENSCLQNLLLEKNPDLDGKSLSKLLFEDQDEPNEVADKALNENPIITKISPKFKKGELDTDPVETLYEKTGLQTITKSNDEGRVQKPLPEWSNEMLKIRGEASFNVKDENIKASYKHNILLREGSQETDYTLANNSPPEMQSLCEKTLATARNNEALLSPPLSAYKEDRENHTTLQENLEAHKLLEDILLAASKKDFKTMKSHSIVPSVKLETYDPEHTLTPITPEDFENTTISSSDDEESLNEENSESPLTLHDVLSSFNKVADTLTTTRYLTSFTSANDFSTQSGEQINRQVEEMKREQREQVSQMIDRVYAQTDKYDDTLEVVDGRLMVVKRSTGALEELPPLLTPSSSSKSTSCGVSTTQASCNDSDSNDYGTALSEDEPDDDDDDDNEDDDDGGDDDGEQHTSDTKIKRIPYLSAGCGNESLSSLSSVTGIVRGVVDDEENNCPSECYEQTLSSPNNDTKFHNEIDAVVFTKVTPAVTLTIEKEWRTEEAALMRKIGERACESKGDGCDQLPAEDFDEAALEDFALIFEMPQ